MRKFLIMLLSIIAISVQPGHGEEPEGITLPILMYHEVKMDHLGKDVILPAEFESDLRYLREQGYTTVQMADVVAYVYQGTPLPEKPIVLSFDDGYLSNYIHVMPLLQKYGAKIVLSIIGRSTDEFSQLPDDNLNYAHVSWQQLREMLDSGLVEVQNHTYNLHKCTSRCKGCCRMVGESGAAYERRLTADLEKLQEELYTETGKAPNTLAYPYGLYSECTQGILSEMGFLATLSCDFGVNRLSRDPDCLWNMKRICRSHGANLEKLLEQAGRQFA